MTGFVLVTHQFDTPLRVSFGHASAVRNKTQTVLVLARPDTPAFDPSAVGIGESCPREYVTGETSGSVLEFVARHREGLQSQVDSLTDLQDWMTAHKGEIDKNPAAFAAMEGALLDFFAKRDGISLEALLDLPPLGGSFAYSAVLGDSRPWKFWLQALIYRGFGFADFKVKISGDMGRDRAKFSIFRFFGKFGQINLRADANNLWADPQSCIRYMEELGTSFWAMEEPVAAGRIAEHRQIAEALDVKVILDESLLRIEHLNELEASEGLFVANIRVSKNGGLLRSLAIAAKATDLGIPLIFGAHVGETSVLTRAGLALAGSFRSQTIAQEGGFGRLLVRQDAVVPSLRFGYGGVLRPKGYPVRPHWGNGLKVAPDILKSIRQNHMT